MRLASRLTGRRKTVLHSPFWSLDDDRPWSSMPSSKERVGKEFEEYARNAYRDNGIVFACALARHWLFSEARFAYQRMSKGRPGLLWSDRSLSLLETPWPNGSIGDLLTRMDQDATLAGNFFATYADDDGNVGRAAAKSPTCRLVRLRPDWVTIVLGSKSGNISAIDTRVIGYQYKPRVGSGDEVKTTLVPGEVMHYNPVPDPTAWYRGMSWLTPVIREIKSDKAATRHKGKFFEQGAGFTKVVTLDKEVNPQQYREFVAEFKKQTEGVDQAYKTLFFGGGADATVTSADMKQLDFKVVQGAGETRIASAAGMHPVIVGLSEGLQGSSLNAGNFQAAVRLTADKTIRPLWRSAATALASLVQAPSGSRLWYDDREVAFLRPDGSDVAAIQAKQATTARQLTDAGYTPESVIEFLETGNLTALQHSGLYSVQLQPAGAVHQPPAPAPEE